MELVLPNQRRGFFRRLARILKKEVTGHGPSDACLSGVIFEARNAPVRQLPTTAMRLPRARAMRPVRRRKIVNADEPTIITREEALYNPQRHSPNVRNIVPSAAVAANAANSRAAQPTTVVLRPAPRSPSPTHLNHVTVPSPRSPPSSVRSTSTLRLPSPPPPPTPPSPFAISHLSNIISPPPPPTLHMHRKYESPPPPPPPLESPPSSPSSSFHSVHQSQQYASPPSSQSKVSMVLDVETAIIDIESDEETNADVTATLSSGVDSIDRSWLLSRSEGSTIKSDETPSPSNTQHLHRRRAWEVGTKPAWNPPRDDVVLNSNWNSEKGSECEDDLHSARSEEEEVNIETVAFEVAVEEPIVPVGTVQQRVEAWMRDGDTSVRTREWRANNGIRQNKGFRNSLEETRDIIPKAYIAEQSIKEEESEAQKRAREWVGATTVSRRTRAWNALSDDQRPRPRAWDTPVNEQWTIESRRNRALPRTVNRRDGRRARTDVHDVIETEKMQLAQDDFIDFQTRPRRAPGARILSNVSSLLGNDNNDSDGELDSDEDMVDTLNTENQNTLRPSYRRKPVTSVLRRAKLLSRLAA